MTSLVVCQVVHQPCHHNLEEMCMITPGQWEQRDQAHGNATNVGKQLILNVSVQAWNIKQKGKPINYMEDSSENAFVARGKLK